MTTYNTNNPLGSSDPRDLYDNAENLDEALNALSPTWNDRFGNSRRSIQGAVVEVVNNANAQISAVTENANTQIANVTDNADTQISQINENANQLITQTTNNANAVISSLGYQPPVPYTAGLEMTVSNQTVSYDGDTYAPIADDLPFTTSGTFETDKFRLVAGVSGADLASDFGASMVGVQAGRTQAALNLDLVNVKNYGGKADSSTDDSVAIASAVSASGANDQSLILFPEGEYKISNPVTIRGTPLFSNSRFSIDPGVNVSFIPYRIKITDYLAIYRSHSIAFKKAYIRLLSSSNTCLDLEGQRLDFEEPVVITPDDTPFNTNFAEDKTVMNGWIRADGGAGWAAETDYRASDSLIKITRNTGGVSGVLLHPKFSHVIFDCQNMPGVKCFQLAAYYNAEFIHCHFRQCTHAFFWAGSIEEWQGNGLTFTDCRIKGQSNQNPSTGTRTGVVTWDADFVWNGGYVEWVRVGFDSHQGGVKIDGCHFSLADTAGNGNQIALICRRPRNVNFVNNDLDGTFVTLTNEDNHIDPDYIAWFGLNFSNNSISGNKLPESTDHGLITCITGAPNTVIQQLNLNGNQTEILGNGNNAAKEVGFITHGAGTFSSVQISGTQQKGFGISQNYDGKPYRVNEQIRLKYINDLTSHAVAIANYETKNDNFSNAPAVTGNGLFVGNGFSGQCQNNVTDATATWRFYRGTTMVAAVYGSGNINNVNNAYGAISDITLKHDIEDASVQWNDIKNIRICNYRFNDNPDIRQIGVIAQEVQQVSPGLVDVDEETGLLSVKYSVLTLKAIKALQEAMARIETLEAEVAALKV